MHCSLWINYYYLMHSGEFFLSKKFNRVEKTNLNQTVPSLWVSRVLKYPKNCLEDLITFFMSTWWGDSKSREEIEFLQTKAGQNVLPDGLNWLCYFAGSTKKPSWEFNLFHIFGIPPSSRHEKRCQILQTIFLVFQYSRNSQCCHMTPLTTQTWQMLFNNIC